MLNEPEMIYLGKLIPGTRSELRWDWRLASIVGA